jgi:hypothetical protein
MCFYKNSTTVAYLAFLGPTLSSLKEELAVMAESGISPDCIPREFRHCAKNRKYKVTGLLEFQLV